MKQKNNTERQYNKRELDMKFQTIIEKVDDNHRDTKEQIQELAKETKKDQDEKHIQNTEILKIIDGKVSLTNGRVKRLEKWQAGIIMSGTVVIFMGGIIVSLIIYIYQYQIFVQNDKITNLITTVKSIQKSK